MQWVIDLIGIYAPDDEIFKKNYKYVRPKEEYDLYLNNKDLFFYELPELDERVIRKTNRLQMPKKMRNELKLKRLHAIQLKLLERENMLEQALAQPDSDDEFDVGDDPEDEDFNDFASEGWEEGAEEEHN